MKKLNIPAIVLMSVLSITPAQSAESLDQILTVEAAADVAGFPATSAKKEYVPEEKRKEREVLTYSWNNGRKKSAGVLQVPAMDTVKFGWLRKSSLLTMQGQAEDPAFKDFMEKVDGVGDFALWNSRDKQLIVLRGEISFSVWVSVSADEAVNKAKCLELGKKLAGKL